MSNLLYYNKRVGAFVAPKWVNDANKKIDDLLRAKKICAACGRYFTEKRKMAVDGHGLCEECKNAL